MGHIRLILFALVTIPVTMFPTQAPPGFSGRWIAVEPQKIAGHELVVTQDAATLRLEQMRLHSGETYDEFGRRQGPQKGERESTMYRLDGQVLVTNRGGQSVRSRLRGDNRRILLRDVYQPPGVTFERSLSFDNRGRLVLEHRLPAPSNDPSQASETVLDIRRIVFERR
jgi:hypothetical protein